MPDPAARSHEAVSKVEERLAAFDGDDLEALRRLFASDGVVYVHARELRG
jgi:hypothetical protein